MLLGIVLGFLIIFLSGFNTFAAPSQENLAVFRETVQKLSSFGDRSTGSRGAEAAAAYIKDRFLALGFEDVDSHKFEVAVTSDHSCVRYSGTSDICR